MGGKRTDAEFAPRRILSSYNISKSRDRRRRRFSAGYVAPGQNEEDATPLTAAEETKGDNAKIAAEFYSTKTYKDIYKDVSVGGVAWDDTELTTKAEDGGGESADKEVEKEDEVKLQKKIEEFGGNEAYKDFLYKQLNEAMGQKFTKMTMSEGSEQLAENSKQGM